MSLSDRGRTLKRFEVLLNRFEALHSSCHCILAYLVLCTGRCLLEENQRREKKRGPMRAEKAGKHLACFSRKPPLPIELISLSLLPIVWAASCMAL